MYHNEMESEHFQTLRHHTGNTLKWVNRFMH